MKVFSKLYFFFIILTSCAIPNTEKFDFTVLVKQNETNKIYSTKTEKFKTLGFKCNYICYVIKNGNYIYNGEINGKPGIVNLKNNSIETLVEGNMFSYSISQNSSEFIPIDISEWNYYDDKAIAKDSYLIKILDLKTSEFTDSLLLYKGIVKYYPKNTICNSIFLSEIYPKDPSTIHYTFYLKVIHLINRKTTYIDTIETKVDKNYTDIEFYYPNHVQSIADSFIYYKWKKFNNGYQIGVFSVMNNVKHKINEIYCPDSLFNSDNVKTLLRNNTLFLLNGNIIYKFEKNEWIEYKEISCEKVFDFW